MVVQITPIGIANLGWRFYIVWAVLNAIIVPVSYSSHFTNFKQTPF